MQKNIKLQNDIKNAEDKYRRILNATSIYEDVTEAQQARDNLRAQIEDERSEFEKMRAENGKYKDLLQERDNMKR